MRESYISLEKYTGRYRAKTFIDFLFNFSELIKERPWAMLVYYAHQASMVFLDILNKEIKEIGFRVIKVSLAI